MKLFFHWDGEGKRRSRKEQGVGGEWGGGVDVQAIMSSMSVP
jgi:hypothetical protein